MTPYYRLLVTWPTADGLLVDRQTTGDVAPAEVLALVAEQLDAGATVVEIKRLTRQQAEKGSV